MLKNVKITTIISPLDLIAPHSCLECGLIGTILCDRCKNNILAMKHNFHPDIDHFPPVYTIGQREGVLNHMIHAYKYDSTRVLAKVFAELLNARLPEFATPVSIVPLPTATHHIRSRGFDHTLLVAKKLAKLRSYSVSRALVRAKNTVQVGADKSTRFKQARYAYDLNPSFTPDPVTTYLLLDDVWTTGASMENAVYLLQDSGAQNLAVLVLAVGTLEN